MKHQSTPFDNHLDPTPDDDAELVVEADEEPIATGDQPVVFPVEKPRFPWGTWLLAGFLLMVLGGGIWAWRWEQARRYEWRWGKIAMPERVARVPEEWTAKTLAERLEKSGKVRESAIFRQAADQVGLQIVQPGAYPLPEKAGPLELAEIFNQPAPLEKVTFPEGFTAARMAERLQKQGFAHAAQFRRMAYPPGEPVSPLEGKLFPDTYYLPVKGEAQELISPLLDRYREVAADLPRPFPKGQDDRPLTLQEITILASIIERETHVASERPLVAGVLLNRLRDGMRLQVDATVQYARDRAAAQGQLPTGHKARLFFRDLEIKSPYNTYRTKGLPSGPICNPGKDSLRAAAQPKQSEYLFYVLSPKLNRHRFSKTFAEHQRNIRLARQERG